MGTTIVTGATGGLGKAIVSQLVRDGHKIVALDKDKPNLDALVEEHQGCVLPYQCDLLSSTELNDFVESEEMKSATGLVNNAGVYLGKPLSSLSDNDIERVLSINLLAPIKLCRAFEAYQKAEPEQRLLVNVCSSSIHGGSDAVYSASKSAMLGLTKSMAISLAPLGRANLIAPGLIDTELLLNVPADVMSLYRSKELSDHPMTPDEIALSVSFLMGPGGRPYNGAVLEPNNGYRL